MNKMGRPKGSKNKVSKVKKGNALGKVRGKKGPLSYAERERIAITNDRVARIIDSILLLKDEFEDPECRQVGALDAAMRAIYGALIHDL